jgi:hypothetical protein
VAFHRWWLHPSCGGCSRALTLRFLLICEAMVPASLVQIKLNPRPR